MSKFQRICLAFALAVIIGGLKENIALWQSTVAVAALCVFVIFDGDEVQP